MILITKMIAFLIHGGQACLVQPFTSHWLQKILFSVVRIMKNKIKKMQNLEEEKKSRQLFELLLLINY